MTRQHMETLDALWTAFEAEANENGVRLAKALAAFEETPEESFCHDGCRIELLTSMGLGLLDLPRAPAAREWLTNVAYDLMGSGDLQTVHCLGSSRARNLYAAWRRLGHWGKRRGVYAADRLEEAMAGTRLLLAG